MRAFYALFVARNREFLRDRATLGWNLAFPFIAVFAIALVFSGGTRDLYKVGVRGLDGDAAHGTVEAALPAQVRVFLQTRYVDFVPVTDLAAAQDKVRHHRLDLVLELPPNGSDAPRYWVNPTNPKGYALERMLWAAEQPSRLQREALEGREIRYVDWLLPGVLSMNIMFSCLWGVGYVIVRYRKGGILRRLKASPITALQFIAAQIASRLWLVLAVTVVLFFGLDLLLDFYRAGGLAELFLVFAVGSVCQIALGILMSCRTSSQELAGGLLNLATWPMMFLSGIWFSLEGSRPWLIWLSKAFPLTHLIDGTRAIMVDGATLLDVLPQIAVLTVMTAVFLLLGALLFRWE